MSTSNPYEAPNSTFTRSTQEEGDVWRDKKYVVCRDESRWPTRCMKCNKETEEQVFEKLSYVNPLFYLTFLLSLPVMVIIVLIVRKKFHFTFPLCDEHKKKKKRFFIIKLFLGVSALLTFFAGVSADSFVFIITSLLLFLTLMLVVVATPFATIQKFKDDKLWIRGAGKAFLLSLESLR